MLSEYVCNGERSEVFDDDFKRREMISEEVDIQGSLTTD